jgi:hypothetical protein
MSASNPKGANAEKALKPKDITLTQFSYKENVYFIINNEGYYEKAVGPFDSTKRYFELIPSDLTEGELPA